MAKQCPVTKEQFENSAKDLVIQLEGNVLVAKPGEFQSGSYGWKMNGKATITIDGVKVPVQVGLNITCIGSKPGGE